MPEATALACRLAVGERTPMRAIPRRPNGYPIHLSRPRDVGGTLVINLHQSQAILLLSHQA
ncbi:MAG TPA: hypothetical protein PLN90_18190, partial [Polyangiaceae bacterium]|nr:hypothetical protein [Polyangiaceae bacterium]